MTLWSIFTNFGEICSKNIPLTKESTYWFIWFLRVTGSNPALAKTCQKWKKCQFQFFSIELWPFGVFSPILVKFAAKMGLSPKKVSIYHMNHMYHIQGFEYRTPKNMQNMKKFQIWVFHHWTIPKWVTFTNFGEICSKIEPVTEKSALQKNMAVASFRQNFKKCKFA